MKNVEGGDDRIEDVDPHPVVPHLVEAEEVVAAVKIDRISRLPLPEAELLVATIRGKGARLAVPGIVDLTDLVAASAGIARIVLEAAQDMLLRVALQTARDDYEIRRERPREGIAKGAGRYTGRKPDLAHHRRIIGLRDAGMSITRTAELAGCSIAQVKRVTAMHRSKKRVPSTKEISEDQIVSNIVLSTPVE